jgi:hypothetical protein
MMWAGQAAFEDRYGGGVAYAEGEEKIAADTIAFVEEDEADGTVRQVDAADTSRRGVVVMENQRNDWVHRGPEKAFLDCISVVYCGVRGAAVWRKPAGDAAGGLLPAPVGDDAGARA